MAVGTIPPWLRGPDTTGELSSGAGAGAAAARLEQESRFESSRLGMEAQRMRQGAAIAQAQLDQQAQAQQMECQARQKLAEQNQLRAQQRMNIEAAYRTAELGIAKGRLEQTQQAAAEKARTAAVQYQREQNFAKDVASGMSPMEAYQRNPVSASVLNSASRLAIKAGEPKLVVREGRNDILGINPVTGDVKKLYTAPTKEGLTETAKEDLKDLRNERNQLEKDVGGMFGENVARVAPKSYQATTNRLAEINRQIEQIKSGARTKPTEEKAPSKFGHPKVGEVRSGYRFKGGDPNDSDNWEIVK